MATVTREFVNHRNRLDQLASLRHSIQVGCLDPVLAPYFDGRIPEGDTRTPALKQAIADLLTAADRVAAQAKADLDALKSAERADLAQLRTQRAEQGRRA